MANSNCIFAKFVRGEVPANTIYEDADHMVFLDKFPVVPGHALVIPKYEASTWNDLNEDQAAAFGRVIRKVTGAMQEYFGCDYEFHSTNGKGASQEIDWLHVHVLPRAAGDRLWDGDKSRLVTDANNTYDFKRLTPTDEELAEHRKGLAELLGGQ